MNTLKKHFGEGAFLASLLAVMFVTFLLLILHAQTTHASIALNTPATTDRLRLYNLFASSTNETSLATTTTATSTNITAYADSSGNIIDGTVDLRGAKRATFYFSRGDTSGQGNTGKSVFRIQVSRDGTTWDDYSHLLGVDVAATATSTVTIGAATSTAVYSMDLNGAFAKARCIVVETTDGEHSCAATVQY